MMEESANVLMEPKHMGTKRESQKQLNPLKNVRIKTESDETKKKKD